MKNYHRLLITVILLLCLLVTVAGCIHYLPRDEETSTPEVTTPPTEQTTPPDEDGSNPAESDPPSPDEIPNEAEGGYTKRY